MRKGQSFGLVILILAGGVAVLGSICDEVILLHESVSISVSDEMSVVIVDGDSGHGELVRGILGQLGAGRGLTRVNGKLSAARHCKSCRVALDNTGVDSVREGSSSSGLIRVVGVKKKVKGYCVDGKPH